MKQTAQIYNFERGHSDRRLVQMGGFALLYRSLLDKGWASNPEYMAAWVRLILKASHAAHEVFVGGETIQLSRGQFFTGRKALAREIGISESACERVLGFFKREGMLGWVSTNRGRVITILNYARFQAQIEGDTPTHTQGDTPLKTEQQNEQLQASPQLAYTGNTEQQNEQQLNSKRTASEHKQQCKKDKQQNNKRSRSVRAHRIPDDFCVTDKMRSWFAEKRFTFDINAETENFILYWRGSGKPKADWVATWQVWMNRNGQTQQPARSGPRRTPENFQTANYGETDFEV